MSEILSQSQEEIEGIKEIWTQSANFSNFEGQKT